ncbi:MAG: endolytic transglycosylase MltG [Thermodesulfobacteriota bacterium]|nr:endolytic transglycosylase MltG [Thermodesulfobacteriota bacterium]
MGLVRRIALICLFLAAVGLTAVSWIVYQYATSPAATNADVRIIEVPPGAGINTIARRLHQQQLIKNPELFKYLALSQSRNETIKAGEYRLSAAMSPLEIIKKMTRGEVVLHKLTIPEGYTIRQIAALSAQKGLSDRGAFLRMATSRATAEKMGINADTLEGYLFPETYFFPASAGAETIINAMVKRFHKIFTDHWERRAREMGFSVHEIVTLASIVEKETAVDAERPLIASVFHNRLKKNMRIESDPTVIYGIENFDGNLTRTHLNTRTPYNTYRIHGLPKGPIANPGEKSLEAVLYPADTPYLYFVAKNDGTHKFSANLRSHNQAVRKYQLGR